LPLPGGAQAEYFSWGLSDYRHPDGLGSDRLESTTSHAIVSASAYAPFGEPYAENGSYGELSFTGANKDTLWLDYDFLYREYDPKQGRWISPDPAGLSAVDPTNPQSWNRYAYVLNNPLGYIDPLGLECLWDDGSFDSEFDGATGSVSGCGAAGGTWVELGQNGNWSDQANQDNQNLVTSIQAGNVSEVDIVGLDGQTYSTFYNGGGQTTEAITGDTATFYSYSQSGPNVGPAANNSDTHPGLAAFYNNPDCPHCGDTLRSADTVGKAAFVATGVVIVGVPLIGEAAGSIAACNPGLNTSNYGHITVYCRAWMAGNLIGIGYDPKNGLHVNVGNVVHIPLWPWQ